MTGSPCWLLVETMTGHYFVCVYIIMMLAAKYYKFFHWLVTIMGYYFLNYSLAEVYIYLYYYQLSMWGINHRSYYTGFEISNYPFVPYCISVEFLNSRIYLSGFPLYYCRHQNSMPHVFF